MLIIIIIFQPSDLNIHNFNSVSRLTNFRRVKMKPFRIIGVLASAALLFACAGSFQRMNHLKLGMTKQEVIQTVGAPDITSASGHVEYLKYRSNTGMFYTDEYYVRLLDGKVNAFGQQGDFNLPY